MNNEMPTKVGTKRKSHNKKSDVLPVGPLGNKQALSNEVIFPASALYARVGRLPSASSPTPEGPHAHAHSSKGSPIVQWAG